MMPRIRMTRNDGEERNLYGAAYTMTLALVTMYEVNTIAGYRQHRNRPGAYLKECCKTMPAYNTVHQQINALCPRLERPRLYIQVWGASVPSHYIVLHKEHLPDGNIVYRPHCDRVLSCPIATPLIADGVLITWPDPNPVVGSGQEPILQRILAGSISTLADEIIAQPELQRELRLSASVVNMYAIKDKEEFSVWTRPAGKSVFRVTDTNITLARTRAYAPNITKPTVVIWGDIANECVPYARKLSRHIVPQIKNAEPHQSEGITYNMFRWALEARLLPMIAVGDTRRGDIFALSYDPEQDEAFVTCIASNRKIDGLPAVTKIDNGGKEVFVPSMALVAQMRDILFAHPTLVHILRGLLKTMAYTTWEDITSAFHNWGIRLTHEEEQALEIMQAEI